MIVSILENQGGNSKAEIHLVNGVYSIKYYINGNQIKMEEFQGNSIHYVEDAAENWINGIKVLNG